MALPMPPDESAIARPGLAQWLQLALGLVLGGVFLALVFSAIDLAAVGAQLARAAWWPLLIALLAYAVDFVLRALRFWMLLADDDARDLPFAPTISPFIASFGISDIVPFRLGDAFRVYWFHRQFRLGVGRVIGAMIIERVLDLVSILALASIALLAVDTRIPKAVILQFQLVLTAAWIIGGLTLLSPAILERLATWGHARFDRPFVQKLAGMARSIAASIRSVGNIRRMTGLIVFSIAIWLLESLVMLGAWISLGGAVGEWLRPFLAFTVSTLGTLVPALPGHFGSYEYFGMLSFRAVGVGATMAAAVIMIAHLILWLPTALFGVGWLMLSRRNRQAPIREPVRKEPSQA